MKVLKKFRQGFNFVFKIDLEGEELLAIIDEEDEKLFENVKQIQLGYHDMNYLTSVAYNKILLSLHGKGFLHVGYDPNLLAQMIDGLSVTDRASSMAA